MKFISKKLVNNYLFAILLMLLAVFIQYVVIFFGTVPVPGILYPMAFLNAWYFGYGPALLTVIISLLCSNYLFHEPRFTFKFVQFADYVRLGIFAATSIGCAYIVARGKKAQIGEFKAKSDLKESLEVLETINRIGKSMSAELDHDKLVQHLTDAGTKLTRADFGAFFYMVVNESGSHLTLHTITGTPVSELSNFIFSTNKMIQSEEISKLPIKSSLVIPVISRTGEVIGGLLFGHKSTNIFTERDEKIVNGLASQAAIAMDNASLFDKANQAIKIRDEFLSISSHELKTPLTPLKMQLQTIAKQIDKGLLEVESVVHFKKNITMAEKQVNRITVLVDDLLDVTRITTGKLTLNVEEVDLVETIKEVVERYTLQLEKSQSDLKLDLVSSLVAKIDRIRFEQVLINLLTNAIKYAPGKSIIITLRLINDKIILKFADMGVGISANDQKKIFDRFERANSHAAQGGLGLGLFIVNQIINAHGGFISVNSREDIGTTFIIELPVT